MARLKAVNDAASTLAAILYAADVHMHIATGAGSGQGFPTAGDWMMRIQYARTDPAFDTTKEQWEIVRATLRPATAHPTDTDTIDIPRVTGIAAVASADQTDNLTSEAAMGTVSVGQRITNVTQDCWAVVTEVVSTTHIHHTALSGGLHWHHDDTFFISTKGADAPTDWPVGSVVYNVVGSEYFEELLAEIDLKMATANDAAAALAAAVTNAIADAQTKAPDGDTVFHALAAKAPSTGIALTALVTQAAYTFLANLTSGAASPTTATAIQAFMLMMRACAAVDHGNLGATYTFNLTTNWVHTGTVDQTVAITLTDPGVAGVVCRLILTATAGGEAISFVASSHLDHAANWANSDMPTAMPTGAGSRMEIFLQRTQDADYYIASYQTFGAKT